MTGIIILVAIVVVGGLVMALYNKLVVLRNRIENAWSQIDVQLRRRYDLIPNLIETVKGNAKHEKELLTGANHVLFGFIVNDNNIGIKMKMRF